MVRYNGGTPILTIDGVLNKECLSCSTVKPLMEYHRYQRTRDGRQTVCKTCRSGKKTSEYGRRYNLRQFHGLELEQWNEMLEKQGGRCAVCSVELIVDLSVQRSMRKAMVDHDHKTGEIRGLLCGHCNTGIGHFQDDPDRLLSAVTYLLTRSKR